MKTTAPIAMKGKRAGSRIMLDIIMLTLVVASFALAHAYARLCDNLLTPPTA